MKKSLSIMLALLMVLSVLSVGTISAGAAEITTITINQILAPAAGNRPDKTAEVEERDCEVDSIFWYNVTDKAWMTDNETFVKGKVYEANVHVKANDGSNFAEESTITATVNKKAATISHVTMEDPEEYLNISCNFTATSENKLVTSIKISGVTEPVAGQKTDKSYTDGATAYTIDAMEWRTPSGDGIYGDNYVFETNTEYQARFYVYPNEGFQFKDGLTATINGNDAVVAGVAGSSSYEYLCIRYVFKTGDMPETEPATDKPTEAAETTSPSENTITDIGIVSVAEPEVGAAAKSRAYTVISADYSVYSVSWYNKTDGYLMMIDDDAFEAGKTYTVRVTVNAGNGYVFNNPTATINGNTAKVSTVSGYNKENRLLISYDFTTPAENSDPEMIKDVNITGVDEPKAGNIPSANATGEDNYFIEAVTWYNSTDSVGIEAPDTFEEGKVYYVNIFLRPRAGYRFNYNPNKTDELDINAEVNGVSANSFHVSSYSRGEYIQINCGFTATGGELPETTTAPEETTKAPEETTKSPEETTAPVEETTAAPVKGAVTKIDITDVIEPKAEAKAVMSATAADVSYVLDGVSWWNSTVGYWMFPDDLFHADTEYSVRIYVNAADGCYFDNPTATVNGKEAKVLSRSGYGSDVSVVIAYNYTLSAEPEEHTHNWGEWAVTKKSTNDEDGEETRVCKDNPEHKETRVIPMVAGVNAAQFKYTYTGKKIKPVFTVVDVNGNILKNGVDYTVNYPNSVNVGAYVAEIVYLGKYEGLGYFEFYITPLKNTVKVSAKTKTAKIKTLKKKAVTVKPLTVKNAKGTVSVTKVKKGTNSKIYKKITVTKKTGAIKIKKGKYKKGTYKIKLKIVLNGGKNYEDKTITKTVKVKIK